MKRPVATTRAAPSRAASEAGSTVPAVAGTVLDMMSTLRSRALAVLAFAFVLGACGTPPEERLAQARAAAADKNLEAYAKFFTVKSANFLRDMSRAAARSKIPYVKDPFALLPEGDIEDVKTEGLSTVLKVKGKRGSAEIRMFMENDEWSIDVYSLPALWAPLRGGGGS